MVLGEGFREDKNWKGAIKWDILFKNTPYWLKK